MSAVRNFTKGTMIELLRLVTDYEETFENTRNWFWLGWVTVAPSHYENPLYKMVFTKNYEFT